MKPLVVVNHTDIENDDLCKILLDARSAMILGATKQARLEKKSASEIRMSRMEADRMSIKMSGRCMKVGTMQEAMMIVREYVDIEII